MHLITHSSSERSTHTQFLFQPLQGAEKHGVTVDEEDPVPLIANSVKMGNTGIMDPKITQHILSNLENNYDDSDLIELAKRIHPVVVVNGILRRIHSSRKEVLGNCFLENPKLKEALTNESLVAQFTTFHSVFIDEKNSFTPFNPTIREVLFQWPKDLRDCNQILYYTTTATITSRVQSKEALYDVGWTQVYSCNNELEEDERLQEESYQLKKRITNIADISIYRI